MSTEERCPAADESALLAALRAGDQRAFEQMVRENAGPLLRTTRRILRSEDDARDAVQEAFIAAFRSIGRFEGGSRLSTWLHRIAVNAALMRLRSLQRHPEKSIEELLPRFLEDGHQAEPAAAWPLPADQLIARQEVRALVRQAIDRLPDTYRNVLLLRDIEDVSTEDAAALLGVTPNAVKIRLHRARQALRGLLDPHIRTLAP